MAATRKQATRKATPRKATVTECELHGIPSCADCSKATAPVPSESLQLLTTDTFVTIEGVRLQLTTVATDRGGVFAVLARRDVSAHELQEGAPTIVVADPLQVFGTVRVPSVVTFDVGTVTMAVPTVGTSRTRKDGTVVGTGRAGRVAFELDGDPFVAAVSIRRRRHGAWGVRVTVRPGRLPVAATERPSDDGALPLA
jgi:hypothetical protein